MGSGGLAVWASQAFLAWAAQDASGPVRYSNSALGGNGSAFQMLIEKVDCSGPSLSSCLFMVPLGVSKVHERMIRAFVCEEFMGFAQAS